ncbi:MAG TPA: hypothetical protein VER96_13620 [Polyangiaceae bacterium]|nr:hypothetical protein [Polyangiaceae bacterium]
MALSVFVRDVKRSWHRELASSPETHAWVLNLYRAGERHPETVLDYFPAEYVEDAELATRVRQHRGDERRHVRLYERAIRALGAEVCEPSGLDVFNNAIRHFTPVSFAIEPEMDRDERHERIAHFLAHAHFLEARIARSLEYHLEACAFADAAGAVAVVETVHRDEQRHTSYTREAVQQLVGARRAAEILRLHALAEERAHRSFSARQVRAFLEQFPHAGRRRDRLIFAAGALLMEGGLPHV